MFYKILFNNTSTLEYLKHQIFHLKLTNLTIIENNLIIININVYSPTLNLIGERKQQNIISLPGEIVPELK